MAVRNLSYKHSSRSYYDVYNALVSEYPNKPDWMFKSDAGFFEFQSELMNRVAQDILYPVTRESAYAFADRCDYSPSEADGSTCDMTITLTGAMSKTIPVGYQVGGVSNGTGKMVIYEVTTASSSGGGSSITAPVRQKKTETSINVGTIESTEAWQEFPIDGYQNILIDTISLVINSLSWTRVDNFDSSLSTDRHFKLFFQSSGKARIQFGDGTTGLIPPLNEIIYATFATTQGLQGRMEAGEININIGKDADIASVTNASDTSGGNNAESVNSIIRNSRANVRTKNVVWSKEDVETKAMSYSSSVIKALCITSLGQCDLYIVPSGGGSPSAGLKTAVQSYVQSYTQFGLMPIYMYNPTYSAENVTCSITVRTGCVSGKVQDYVEFAMTLVTSAIDNQVLDYYDENGIDDTRVDIINSLWSWAFTEDDNDALEYIIEKWKELLGTRDFREFGQPLEVGDLWQMGNSLYEYGVDIFSLTSPTTNQTCSSTEIIDTGTIIVTVV